jgi:hypothetical protein
MGLNGVRMTQQHTLEDAASKETSLSPPSKGASSASSQPGAPEKQMEAARRIMKKRRNALRQLAK